MHWRWPVRKQAAADSIFDVILDFTVLEYRYFA